jgi:hypothetical protein
MRFGNLLGGLTKKKEISAEERGRNQFEANKAKHTQKQIMKRRAANKRLTQHKRK